MWAEGATVESEVSADFESWSKESLVRFARDANERIREQKVEIEALQADLKAAIEAYRDLVRQLRVAS